MMEMAKHITNLDTLAGEINSIKNQTRQMILNASIEIGRRLTDAKELCPHGQWGDWLKNKVDYSQRTAQNLMKIFEEYGNNQINLFGQPKTQALADLGYTQAVALLSLPSEEREEFVEENDIDNMTTRELQEAIREKKEAETALQDTKISLEESQYEIDRLNKLIEQLTETSEDSETLEKVQELMEQLEEKKKDLIEAQEEINRLVEEINSAEKNNANDEEIEKLKEQLKKKNENIKKLQEDLKKPPEKEIVEVVPDKMQKEFDAMKAKLANEDSPLMAKFRLQFEGMQKDFTELKVTMAEMSEVDAAVGEKLKNAMKALAQKMAADL